MKNLFISLSRLLEVWPEGWKVFSIPHFSLRNLVSGYECGRVFPPGVGPGSPSRNAANWLSSRVSRSVAAAVWLAEDGVPRCSPLPCSNLVPFGRWRHARGREHCRGEPVSARSGGYAPDSTRAGGSSIVDEPGEC